MDTNEFKNVIARIALLPKAYVLDFRNGEVTKNGVKVTTIKLTPEGLANYVKAVKLGLI